MKNMALFSEIKKIDKSVFSPRVCCFSPFWIISARFVWANTLATLKTISAFLALTRSVLTVRFKKTWKSFVYMSRFSWTNDSLRKRTLTSAPNWLQSIKHSQTTAWPRWIFQTISITFVGKQRGDVHWIQRRNTSDSPFVRHRSVLLWLRVGRLPRVSPRLDVAQPRLQHLNTETAHSETTCIHEVVIFLPRQLLYDYYYDNIIVIVRPLIKEHMKSNQVTFKLLTFNF